MDVWNLHLGSLKHMKSDDNDIFQMLYKKTIYIYIYINIHTIYVSYFVEVQQNIKKNNFFTV